ncbi:transposase [filamentous cyanobacterium LEGE 07170]|nr:transposase [filamentous cyanobacterium LEGE 07170]
MDRPAQDEALQAPLKRQAWEDEAICVAIEGKFGQAKRRFSLGRVMAKRAQTAQTAIAITILVLNLERWLRCLLAFLLGLVTLTLVRFELMNVLQQCLNCRSRQPVSLRPCHA